MNNARRQRLPNLPAAFFIKSLVPLVAILASLLLHNVSSLFQATAMRNQPVSHVVVIGGGLAGLSAASKALVAGARVTLIDKETIGGNSAKATSGMNAVRTKYQLGAGIDDSVALFIEDVLRSGQGKADRRLAHVLASYSAEAVDFLETKLGAELSNVAILGGHSKPRTHRLATGPGSKPIPIGFTVINSLKAFLKDEKWKGKLDIMENTAVTDLELTDKTLSDGSSRRIVTAVKVSPPPSPDVPSTTPVHLPLDALVIASGGFSADLGPRGLVTQYSEIAAKCPYTTNGKFATGDFIKVGQRLGFQTVDLDQIQLHPTGFVDPKAPYATQKFLCPEVFRGSGAVLLNANGERFVDELDTRDNVSKGINQFGNTTMELKLSTGQPGNDDSANKIATLLMNQNVRSRVGESVFDFYKSRGFIQELGQREEVAAKLGWDSKTLDDTLDSYNDALNGKSEDRFGKTVFPTEFARGDTLYTAFVTPAVHYTMGGLKINTMGQVLGSDQQPVVNLFGAGESTGGVHGANRLGGNGMLESVVFGGLAGQNAASLHISEFSADPYESNQVVAMTVNEFSPMTTPDTPNSKSDSSDFSFLSLSYQSLYQKASLDLGTTVHLDISLEAGPHRTAPVEVSLVAAPAVSALGHLDFIIPTFPRDALSGLHPGDNIEVRLSTTDTLSGSSSLMSSGCDASNQMVVVHVSSLDVNAAAQVAAFVENKPHLQLQIVLIGPSSVNLAPLRNFLEDKRPNIRVVEAIDDASNGTKAVRAYIEKHVKPTVQLYQGVAHFASCLRKKRQHDEM